jgi:hypothetical protein
VAHHDGMKALKPTRYKPQVKKLQSNYLESDKLWIVLKSLAVSGCEQLK